MATPLCKEHNSLHDAMRRYHGERGPERPQVCGIGIANPILGDRVQTNHHTSFSITQLHRDLGVERLVVINDFTAWTLPALAGEDLSPVGGGEAVPGAPRAVVGPGTGLGVSGCCRPLEGSSSPSREKAGTARWRRPTNARQR